MIHRLMITLGAAACFSNAYGQLPEGLPIPPENYATTHFWGSPGTTSVDHLALGGAYVADNHADWHGNPAGVLAHTTPAAIAYYTSASFKRLPTFESGFLGYAQPLGSSGNTALKISYTAVRADGNLGGTPINLRAEENDPGVEIGHRFTDRLTLGIGTSYISTKSEFTIPGLGTVTELESRPIGLGGRLGMIYALNDKISLGATLDKYTERVVQRVPAFGLPDRSFTFRSSAYRVGIAYKPNASTKLLADYEQLSLEGNDTTIERQQFMAGVEHRVGPVTLRVGSFDAKLTGGLGFEYGPMQFSYGFTNRYAKSLPGQGAETAHALQVDFRF